MSSRGPPSQASQVPSRPFSARPPSPARPLGSIQWSAPRTVYNPTPLPHSVSIPPLYGRRGSTGFYDTPIGQHQVQVAVDEFGRPRHDWGGPSYAYTAPRLATSPTSPPRPQSSFIFTSQSLRQSASPVSPANDVAVASAPPPLAGRRRSIAAGSGDSLPRRPKTPPDCCAVCAVTETAEWRKGPAGNRSLCNGCGLLAAKRAKERELQGFAPPATLDEIERELEAIGAERFKSVDGRYVLPEGTKQRIIETQERTRAAAAARPESAPRRSRSKSVRAQAHERVAEDARKVAANALIGMSRRASVSSSSGRDYPSSMAPRSPPPITRERRAGSLGNEARLPPSSSYMPPIGGTRPVFTLPRSSVDKRSTSSSLAYCAPNVNTRRLYEPHVDRPPHVVLEHSSTLAAKIRDAAADSVRRDYAD
ncbi:hypothetical protein JCM10021v2_000368 [Rhodotorula toruloides]